MSIEWPNIAQGSGTGTTYTSPDNFTWIWTGSAWEGKGNSFRGFPQPWVIFNFDGSPVTYPTLASAMINSSSGDTIHLYGNVTETPGVPLYHDININFNGHTLAFDFSAGIDYGFSNFDVIPFNIKMYNGTVKFINENAFPADNRTLIHSYNTSQISSTYNFEGMTFITERNIVGYFFNANVIGGNFISTGNNPAFNYNTTNINGSTQTGCIISDIYAESNGDGILITNSTTSIEVTYTFKNIIGRTNSTGVNRSGIRLYYNTNSTGKGHINLVECMGINCAQSNQINNSGIFVYSSLGNSRNFIRLSECLGVATNNIGINVTNCELTNCVGDGLYDFDLDNVNASGCANIKNPADIAQGEISYGTAVSQMGNLVIDNCAFSTGVTASDSQTGASLLYKLDIRNSTIYSYPNRYPIVLSGYGGFNSSSATKIKINNNVIGFPGIDSNPIVVNGGTGSEATNNVMFSVSGVDSPNTAIAGGILPMYIRSNIDFGCWLSSHIDLSGSNISNQGNIIHP